jgi:hypothetical protein
MRIKFILLFSVLLSHISMSQDLPKKWAIDPVISSSFYDPNNTYIPAELPAINYNYINTNTASRFYYGPTEMIVVAPSQRVLPRNNVHQSEVTVVNHPTNPNMLFGSSNAIAFVGGSFTTISEGVYVSTNGGVSWFGTDTLQGAPINNHGGDPGPALDKNSSLIMTHLGFSTAGMFGNGSTDNGVTWSPNFTIQGGSVDKNLAVPMMYLQSVFWKKLLRICSVFCRIPARISLLCGGWRSACNTNCSTGKLYSQGN